MNAPLAPRATRAALLDQGLAEFELALSDDRRQQLLDYVELIVKWNRVHNLTAIRDPDAMVTHHLLDSLAILPYVGAQLADVGSGAGLPGIPLAIARPDCEITLIESNGKKAAFLCQAVAELGLANVAVAAARAEAFRPAERFDTVVARAFAAVADFAAAARHLLAPRGRMLAMKGAYPRSELKNLPSDMRVAETIELKVPQLAAERHLLILTR